MFKEPNQVSPCNHNCIIDPDTHLCKGCFRTIDEIIRWQLYSVEEKNKILNKVEIRRDDLIQHQKPS